MEKKKQLTKKEASFCKLYVQTRNAREAAMAAGFSVFPRQAAEKLMAEPRVQKEIRTLEKNEQAKEAELIAGYRRLAFGSIADAVRLLLADTTGEVLNPEELDLFMVSELKRPKTGGLEIKFFDRLKALEKLAEMRTADADSAMPFYKALEKSAQALQKGGDGTCN